MRGESTGEPALSRSCYEQHAVREADAVDILGSTVLRAGGVSTSASGRWRQSPSILTRARFDGKFVTVPVGRPACRRGDILRLSRGSPPQAAASSQALGRAVVIASHLVGKANARRSAHGTPACDRECRPATVRRTKSCVRSFNMSSTSLAGDRRDFTLRQRVLDRSSSQMTTPACLRSTHPCG